MRADPTSPPSSAQSHGRQYGLQAGGHHAIRLIRQGVPVWTQHHKLHPVGGLIALDDFLPVILWRLPQIRAHHLPDRLHPLAHPTGQQRLESHVELDPQDKKEHCRHQCQVQKESEQDLAIEGKARFSHHFRGSRAGSIS